ncbi:MAG: AAA family ATPase, partial [Trueperaceae bacterium]|nr:AAA family ATPase [Trueperaceae bacterium]
MNDYEPTIEGIDAIPEDERDQAERTHTERERNKRRDLAGVFRSVRSWEWLDGDPPPARPLVELANGQPWMPRGKTAMLAAPGGTGKSQALIQLALCVACDVDSGREWLGQFNVPPEARGPVVLALGEEGAGDMHRRIINALNVLEYTEDEREAIGRNLYALPLAGRPSALLDDPMRVERAAYERAKRQGGELTEAEAERASLGYTEQVARWDEMLRRPPELG